MSRKYLELVGVLVTNTTKLATYHIDYVYKLKVGGRLEGIAIQKGYDWSLHVPFKEILGGLLNAYAPALQKVWIKETPRLASVFMSLVTGCDPNNSGCPGDWRLYCER